MSRVGTARRRSRGSGKYNPNVSALGKALEIVTKRGECLHALAQHDEIVDKNNRTRTISYALPCRVGIRQHRRDPNGKWVHRDSTGREWT